MELTEYLYKTIRTSKESKIRNYPCHVNRASQIGHPCIRYLVYCRTHWREKPLHSWEVQIIFDIGNQMEALTLRDFQDAGIQIVEWQRPFEWKEYELTGHIDGSIIYKGESYPVEIKSMSPFTYKDIHSVKDMMEYKYMYMRNYPAQMMAYLLMANKEKGLFCLRNKQNGEYKFLTVDLDYEYMTTILDKLEKVNQFIKENNIPQEIYQDTEVCLDCDFKYLCMPDIKGSAITFDNNKAVEKQVADYLNLNAEIDKSGIKEKIKQRDNLRDSLKKTFEGKERIALSDKYLITGKWCGKKDKQYWKFNIHDLENV